MHRVFLAGLSASWLTRSVRSALIGGRLALCFLAFALLSPPAVAETVDSTTRAAARGLGYEGVKAYEAGDYVLASERLERAYDALKVPSLALWSGRALEKQGRLVEASERYLEATRLQLADTTELAVQQKAQSDAAEARVAVQSRLAHVVIEVRGAEPSAVQLTVGSAKLSRSLLGTEIPVNPGPLVVVAEGNGRRAEVRVTLAEGEHKTLALVLASPSANRPPPARATPAVEHKTAASTVKLGGPIALITVGGAAFLLGLVAVGAGVACNNDPYGYCNGGASVGGGAFLMLAGAGLGVGGAIWLNSRLNERRRLVASVAAPALALGLMPARLGSGLALSGNF